MSLPGFAIFLIALVIIIFLMAPMLLWLSSYTKNCPWNKGTCKGKIKFKPIANP